MFGKAALMIVLGLSSIMALSSVNDNDVASVASRNFVDHYCSETAHQIALAGANMAANGFFVSPAWEPGSPLTNADLMDGTVNVTKEVIDPVKGRIRLVSTGRFMGEQRTVTIVMQSSNFAKFCLYINDFGTSGFFATGDLFTGPVHCNVPFKSGVPDPAKALRLKGNPVFKGKVTSDLNWKAMDGSTNPTFEAGFEDKIHVTLPTEYADRLINAARTGDYDQYGNLIKGFEFTDSRNVSIYFNGDGTMSYKEFTLTDTSFNTMGKRSIPPTDPTLFTSQGWKKRTIADLSKNGSFLIRNGNLRIRGVLDGKITIGVLSSSATDYSSRGNVYFEDDVTYKANPYTGSSDDLLGIVAQNYIYAADTPENKSDLVTMGALFSKNRGVITENMSSISSKKLVCGNWEYRGGVTDGVAQTTGILSSSKIYGFNQRFIYDTRLLKDSPPFFPCTGALQILSWLEE